MGRSRRSRYKQEDGESFRTRMTYTCAASASDQKHPVCYKDILMSSSTSSVSHVARGQLKVTYDDKVRIREDFLGSAASREARGQHPLRPACSFAKSRGQ